MVTVTAPWWLLDVLIVVLVIGLGTLCWTAAVLAERLADWLRGWWHDRQELSDEDEVLEDEVRELLLPPERTWEQMTSHQLPLERQLVDELDRQGWFDADVQDRLRAEYEARHQLPLEASRIIGPEVWVTDAWSQEHRERRPPAYEAEHRAHYVAMGFDYPSGLMARVRELAP